LPDQAAFPQGERIAYESVQTFAYRAPTTAWALSRVRLAMAALAAWLLLGIIWAIRGFRRLELD
jgi:hypothetical protein